MKNLFKSLAAFQQEVPTIHKGTQGYGYSYSDLPTIFDVINPLLKKHGLGFTQLIEGRNVKTIVFHVDSGESIECSTEIPQGVTLKGMNDFQVLGSAITYIRRYAISAALGLVTDKDSDISTPKESKKKGSSGVNTKSNKPLLEKGNAMYKAALAKLQKGETTVDRIKASCEVSDETIAEMLKWVK